MLGDLNMDSLVVDPELEAFQWDAGIDVVIFCPEHSSETLSLLKFNCHKAPWLACTARQDLIEPLLASGAVATLHPDTLFAATLSMQIQQARLLFRHRRHQPKLDSLTGLLNFSGYLTELEKAQAQVSESGRMLVVVALDIVGFNQLNKQYGYRFADELLVMFAQRIQQAVGDLAQFARLGGDGFLALLPDVPDLSSLSFVSQKILTVCSEAFQISEETIHIQIAMGQVIFPETNENAEGLIRCAQDSLDRAKRKQKSVVVHHQSQVPLSDIQIENDLLKAIRREEFALYYQPKVDVKTGAVKGVEALIRWHHKDLGVISPGDFIPVAEDTGLIVPLGLWIIERACQDIQTFHANGLKDLNVAVNVSFVQLKDDRFGQQLLGLIQRLGVDAQVLELELTETAVLQNYEQALSVLTQLNRWGVTVALDDFGTGYSSLAHIQQFPIDVLKIDRSFIQAMEDQQDRNNIVESIIGLAHSLKLTVVAEGVETTKQYKALADMECDLVQGYLISKPAPLDQVLGIAKQKFRIEPRL